MINALLASLSTKAAAAAIAGTVAAGGLGVAAVTLPDQGAENIPVETVEDESVSTASVEGEGGDAEELGTLNEEEPAPVVLEEELDPVLSEEESDADAAKDSFGARVSEDAKDGGVDGREIANEASEGRSEAGREKAAEASQGRSDAGAENRTAGDEARTEHQPEAPAPEQADAGEAQAEERNSAGQANRPADAGDDDEDDEELQETPES